jgi:hypothetical protein
MFSRLTILLFVFFALAGLLRVATPDAPRVAKAGSDEAASVVS